MFYNKILMYACNNLSYFPFPPLFIYNTSVAIDVALDLRKYILEIYDDFLTSDGLVSIIILS